MKRSLVEAWKDEELFEKLSKAETPEAMIAPVIDTGHSAA